MAGEMVEGGAGGEFQTVKNSITRRGVRGHPALKISASQRFTGVRTINTEHAA
jgi:hypothetical protein